jgi:hypothetical protein
MSLPLRLRRGPAPGASVVRQGVLHGGLPYLAVGQGPPLVVFSAFTAEHANPTGPARRFSLQPLRPLAGHFTVYLVNRKPGVQSGSTIADLAGHYAQALERAFTGPVAIIGISTGGSVTGAGPIANSYRRDSSSPVSKLRFRMSLPLGFDERFGRHAHGRRRVHSR